MAIAKRVKPYKIVMPVLLTVFVAACASLPRSTNNMLGTLAGAAVGAGIGSQIGQGNGRIVAITAGALAGAWVGHAIAQSLDPVDRAHLAMATRRAVRTGRSQSWTDRKTGVHEKIVVVRTVTRRVPAKIVVVPQKVRVIPHLALIDKTYVASEAVNVRNGPSLTDKVVGHLVPSEPVEVVGRVLSSRWFMIARHKVADGFVYMSLLHPAPLGTESVSHVPRLASVSATKAPVRTVVAGHASSRKKAAATRTVAMTATTVQTCRMVNQELTTGSGHHESQTIMACKGPGGWKIVTA